MTLNVDASWHETYFDAHWLRIAHATTEEHTRRETDFVMRVLGLRPGMHVADVPCGRGRHALELARRGVRVTGVDSGGPSIEIAEEAARCAGMEGSVRFAVGDMRTVRFDPPADAVMIMQTSFGFMADEREDLGILRNLREGLVPGGRLLLDLPSLFRLARSMVVPRRWERLPDGTVHIEEREYDFRTGRRNVRVELFSPDGGHVEKSHSIRIYAPHELDAMLREAGYRMVRTYGEYDGRPFGFDTRRLIVLAERTES